MLTYGKIYGKIGAGKRAEKPKYPCTYEAIWMYQYASGQIRFEDFGQPVGMHMSPNNRWVKRAESIPWEDIEHRYAGLFKNRKGNVAKPLRLALGACIIQTEYGYSDEETSLQIQEGPYL